MSDVEGIDPDLPSPRPAYHAPSSIALVFAGGVLGTGGREALSLAIPPVDGVPLTILGINVAGAFCLGLLLEGLHRRGPDHGRRRRLRLLAGTGFLGGFTTYSALAADTAMLLGDRPSGVGLAYALGTLVLGAAATWAGIAAASARTGGRAR
ncbi:CrcB family protein [Aeromicrobium sp. YIM 150415]|uniref:fluoride efflux transporter FluC n=1 Tax=Aeromicrobium sp. YIM 150415 TaxID=2803912 RepID=UPI0019650340|nr:CrcB family protein [Aeromicrobium sp. YIM 150415]MBM9465344.1 CrcB family protein [Aeromicrobium sp. YIM 150415]